MSEGAANINLAPEFRKHPDRAKWLVEKVLPAMKQHFEDFDVNVVVSALTDDSMDVKRIKSLYNSHQRKQQKFQADGIKKPRSAYFFFCDEKRTELKSENESLDFGGVNKKLGDIWSNLSEAEKKPYEDQASEDKQRYDEEYESAKKVAIDKGEFKENPMKNIKKPKTSYLCFSTDKAVRNKYAKQAGDDNKKLMKILGDVWKAMPEKQKKPYIDEAEKDKQRYNKEKSAMEKKLEKEGKSVSHSKSVSDNEESDQNSGNESNDENSKPKKQSSSSKAKASTKAPSKESSKPSSKNSSPKDKESSGKNVEKAPAKKSSEKSPKQSDKKGSSKKPAKKGSSSDEADVGNESD